MKRWLLWGIVLFMGLFTGCAFFDSASSNFLFPTDEIPEGSANVKFKIVALSNDALGNALSIRPSQESSQATVLFRLVLVFPGNSTDQVRIIQKIVDVNETGQAEVSFSGVPATTVVGQIQINGGSLNGKTDFHGGTDLVAGENQIELAPIGSEHSADLTAKVLLDIINTPELVKASPKNLVSSLQTTLQISMNMGFSGSDLYSDAVDRFVSSSFFSSLDYTKLTLTPDGGLKAEANLSELWNKSPDQLLNGIADSSNLMAVRILRQSFNTNLLPIVIFADSSKSKFVLATVNLTDGSINKYFVADSATLSNLSSVVAANDFVVFAAVANGLPVLCRWNILNSVNTGWPMVANSAIDWSLVFPDIVADGNLPFPKVEQLSFLPEDGKSVQCVVRDPKTLALRNYHVTSYGVVEARQATTTVENFKWPLVAIPGNKMNTLIWDEIPGVDYYTIYWSQTSEVSLTGENVKSVSHVSRPFIHTGLTENQPYNYLLTWTISGSEQGPSCQASATPFVETNSEKFKVVYMGNGQSSGSPPTDPVLYETGSEAVILDNTGQLFKTNYPFIGWGVSPDGFGSTFLPGEKFTFGTYDLVLYAQWHKFAGGSGTAEDPYLVATAEQLNRVREYRDCHFKQIADIDLSDFISNSEFGWSPIGPDNIIPFIGVYDGNSKKITNLFINLPEQDFIGLFGQTKDAEIINLNLENADITGRWDVGILAGAPAGTYVKNCQVSGKVTAAGGCGGLIGISGSTNDKDCVFLDSSSNVTISANGGVGGLIGQADGATIITNCSSVGAVTAVEGGAGGLIGSIFGDYPYNRAVVKNCFATGDVSSGAFNVGGLIGVMSYAEVSSSNASGKVKGKSVVGGLVGRNCSIITDCFATGFVEGESFVGGFVGDNTWDNVTGSIARCYSTGAVKATGQFSGGFAGENIAGDILDSFSTGSVSGQNYIGGFCGYNDGHFARCYTVSSVNVDVPVEQIGGFCGGSGTSLAVNVENSFYDVLVTGCPSSFGGTGTTTEEMWKQSTYTINGWDFDSIWLMNPDSGQYPVLR